MKNQEALLSDAKILISKNLDVNLSLDFSSQSIRTRRSFQHFASIRPSDEELKITLENILYHAFQAEASCPGSGKIFLEIFCGKKHNQDSTLIPKTKREILKVISNRNYSGLVEDLLKSSLDLTSSNSKIFLKKSSSQSAYIEVTKGFNFFLNSLLKIQIQEVPKVKVACIDGYIESVSEIHHLLEFLSFKKLPCLLVSRGMSDDVLNTLKVNNDRKTIQIFPYRAPFEVESINTIVDIAVASGTDVVSSTKGNLISSLNLDSLGEFTSCIFSQSSLRANSESSRSLKNHLLDLKNRASERPDISEILSNRIKSLTSDCIHICIPEDINFFNTSSQLDEGIRIISSIISNSYNPYETAFKYYDSFKKNFASSARFLL